MRIHVAGATGYIGRPLCGALLREGHQVTAISRDPHTASRLLPKKVHHANWSDDGLQKIAATADAWINLAGASIGEKRWTPEYKNQLRASRVDTTRSIVDAIRTSGRPGQTLINASAVGYYGDQGSLDVTEQTPPGSGFLAELAQQWEKEALQAADCGSRVVLTRFGVVLSDDGGALTRLLPMFRMGLGGPLGSGRQWFPWVHRADVVSMLVWLIGRGDASGPFNVTAPEPITNATFARALGRSVRRPACLPAPGFALRLLLGEFAESLLTGQKVIPRAAERLGFTWKYSSISSALANIVEGREIENE